MAEPARLVIELVDRGGTGGPTLGSVSGGGGVDTGVSISEFQKLLMSMGGARSIHPGHAAAPNVTSAKVPEVLAEAIEVGTPPSLNREQLLDEGARRAPPVAGASSVAGGPRVDPRVQGAVNSLAQLAGLGGPLASSLAHTGAVAASQFPALASALSALAPAAPYLAVATAAVAIPTVAALTLQNEAERARGLSSGFSSEATAAQAQADVRAILAQIRSANRLGDEAADYIMNTSRIGVATQNIRDIVSEPILKTFNTLLANLTVAVEGINRWLENNPDFVERLQVNIQTLSDIAVQYFLPGGPFSGVMQQMREIERIMRLQEEANNSPFGWLSAQGKLAPPKPFTESNNVPFGGVKLHPAPGMASVFTAPGIGF